MSNNKINGLINNYIQKIVSLDFHSADFTTLPVFLAALGIHYKPKVITVTGTNGKGSTVALISEVLQYNSINHITHTSPHLKSFNERVCYNQQMISDINLQDYLDKLLTVSQDLQLKLHYHFVAFLAACLLMQDKKPEWLVLEVGVGGRLDPANLFDADIAVITSVGFDHCELLGDTLGQIALNKVAIARQNKPLISGAVLPIQAIEYINQINAQLIHASTSLDNRNRGNIHPIPFSCALSVINNFPEKITLPPMLSQLVIPGRFQQVSREPKIIVDVAHNPQAVENFIQKIIQHKISPEQHVIALFSATDTKDLAGIVNCAKPHVDSWLLPDLRALDSRFKKLSYLPECFENETIRIYEDHISAFNYVLNNARANDLIIVFGSFVLVGAFLTYYEEEKANKKNDL